MGSIAPSDYVAADEFVGEAKPIKIIVIGAGISGIAFAYKAQALQNVDFVIRTVILGLAIPIGRKCEYYFVSCCLIVVCGFMLILVANRYAGAEEIWGFYRDRAREYKVYEKTKFEHQVVGAKWGEGEGKWTVEVKDEKTGEIVTDSAEILINCGGALKYGHSLVTLVSDILLTGKQ
jgi:hypothetical protein